MASARGSDASGTAGPSVRADHRRNRESILEAATAELSAGSAATTADVARRAGVTRATVYRHFPDRDALVDAVVGRMAEPFALDLLDHVDRVSLGEAMTGLAEGVLGLVEEHRSLLRAVAPRLDQLARQHVDDEPLTRWLGRRRARGELSSPLSDAWIAACVRAVCLAAIADERPATEVAAELALTLRTLVGLAAPPEG